MVADLLFGYDEKRMEMLTEGERLNYRLMANMMKSTFNEEWQWYDLPFGRIPYLNTPVAKALEKIVAIKECILRSENRW